MGHAWTLTVCVVCTDHAWTRTVCVVCTDHARTRTVCVVCMGHARKRTVCVVCMGHAWGSTLFGLNKILFIHRNHKFNKEVQETQKQYAYLSVTYGQNDNYIDIYDGKMANSCQKV